MWKLELIKRGPFVLVVLTCALLVVAATTGGGIRHDSSRLHYRIRNADPKVVEEPSQHLWKASEYSIKAETVVMDGRSVLAVERNEKSARGQRAEYKFFADARTLAILRLERRLLTRAGKQVEYIEQNYENHFHQFPPDTFHQGLFSLVPRKMNLALNSESEFHMMFSPEWEPLGIAVLVEGEETVTVPAGTFDCLRLRMRYKTDNLPGFFRKLPTFLVSSFLPDILLWVEKKEPHALIKMAGKLEGFGSPDKVHELYKVD